MIDATITKKEGIKHKMVPRQKPDQRCWGWGHLCGKASSWNNIYMK